jgi:hypothetical protein
MNRIPLVAAAIAGAIIAGPVQAQQAIRSPWLVGFGSVPGGCGTWAAQPENSSLDVSYESWVFGFVSGINTTSVPSMGRADFIGNYNGNGNSLGLWAKRWCRAQGRQCKNHSLRVAIFDHPSL